MTTNALIIFEDDDLIRAAETNDNNRYLENKIDDVRTTLNAYIQSQILSSITSFQNSLYPVGSVYIGTTKNCPLASLFGTWEKVGEGRVLQGADDDHEAGTTIEAGLPNITGTFSTSNVWTKSHYNEATGVFDDTIVEKSNNAGDGGTEAKLVNYDFDAHRSSSIYRDDVTTVQAPAYVVNIWRRIN